MLDQRGYNDFEDQENSDRKAFDLSVLSKSSHDLLLDRVYKIGIGLIVPPGVIIPCGLYAYVRTGKTILLVPQGISIFALLFAVVLTYTSKASKTRPSNGLLYSLYAIHIITACYFLAGVVILFIFSKEEELSTVLGVSIFVIESMCLKYIVWYAILFAIIRKLAVEYQFIRNYVQVIQISLVLCGIGIWMACISYRSSWDNLDLAYHIPPIILDLGTISGFLLVLLSFLMYSASYLERMSLLLLFQVFSIVMVMFLFLYTAMVKHSIEIYNTVILNNCSYLLKILDYRQLACGKYLKGDCDREFKATVWETGLNKDNNCLNPQCCFELQQQITLSLDFLMTLAMLSGILMVFSWMSGQSLAKKIEKYGTSYKNSGGNSNLLEEASKTIDCNVLSLMIVLILLSLAGCFTLENQEQRLSQNTAPVKIKNDGRLENQYISSTVLASNHSELHAYFNTGPDSHCHINLTYPRCGGARIAYLNKSEVFVTPEVSASHYLVYAKSQNFANDSVSLYSGKAPLPQTYLKGSGTGVWVLYCIDGKQGIESLKVLDYYLDALEAEASNICLDLYGKETWD